jgi:hypothetical protein
MLTRRNGCDFMIGTGKGFDIQMAQEEILPNS